MTVASEDARPSGEPPLKKIQPPCGTGGLWNVTLWNGWTPSPPTAVKYFLALVFALLLAPLLPQPAHAADPTANKALYDRTVDRLNFQTMERVYDTRFVREKFPVNLLTRAQRREFKDFHGDAAFEKLFHNYNDEAEKFKNKFGPDHGPTTLDNFEKGLRGILVNANFEFFVSKLRKDDRSALIRKLEGTIKQAVAQYDASGEAVAQDRQPDTLTGAAPTEVEAAASDEQVADLNQSVTPADATPAAEAAAPAEGKGSGWSGTLALLLALAAAAGVGYLMFVVVPSLRAQAARVAEAAQHAAAQPAPVDDNLPATYAEESRQRSVELRFELMADEVDELKARINELEHRLADLLAAPEEDLPVAVTAPAPVAPTVAPYVPPVREVAHIGPEGELDEDEEANA